MGLCLGRARAYDEEVSSDRQPDQEPEWRQPPFAEGEPTPTVSGPVLLPDGTPAQPPSRSLQFWKTVRRLLWPVAILLWLVTGQFWYILIALVGVPLVGIMVREAKLRQLGGHRTEELR